MSVQFNEKGIATYIENAIKKIIDEQVANVTLEEKRYFAQEDERVRTVKFYEITPKSREKKKELYNNIRVSIEENQKEVTTDFVAWLRDSKRTCDAISFTENPYRPCNILDEIFTKIKEDKKKISTQDAEEIKKRISGLEQNVFLGRKIDEITVESSGGKRHKRSVHKRSVHKRSVHKRSRHKRSRHKRSRQ